MAALKVFRADPPRETVGEFDACTLCGHVTTLLVSVRANDMLVSICGRCCGDLQGAYEAMLSHRLAYKQRHPDEVFDE